MTDVPYELEAGFEEAQGRRETMEDTHCVISDAKSHADLNLGDVSYNNVAFYGVFDGHGGVDAAQMVEKHLHKNILEKDDFKNGNIEGAINSGFEETDNLIVKTSNQDGWMNGSTAVVGVLVDSKLYVANIGDSEAILVKQNSDGTVAPEALTTPHKASDPSEKKRIEGLGGHVFFGRVFGALAVSRSFGDSKFKIPKTSQNFVSWEPAIHTATITPEHKFLVFACDGLWDVMNHQEVADFVSKQREQGKNAEEIAKALVRAALDKKTEDNVTIVVVFFNWKSGESKTDEPIANPTSEASEASETSQTPAAESTEQESSSNPAEVAPANEEKVVEDPPPVSE